MWNEKLIIGVSTIDAQHKELFNKMEELLNISRDNSSEHKNAYKSIILFLKNYVVNHFAEEEAYQKSIGYKDIDAHQKLHKEFIKNVLKHEKKLVDSDFATKDVKEFIGMLATWLIYHVSDVDPTMIREIEQTENSSCISDIVYNNVRNIMHKVIGLEAASIKRLEKHEETSDDRIINAVECINPAYKIPVDSCKFIKRVIT